MSHDPADSGDLLQHPDGLDRCWWPGRSPLYLAYHDDEWGHPIAADDLLFEHLCLEAFQAGLSWLIVLRKRAAFRRAFHDFDPRRVASMTSDDVQRLLADTAIVRNRAKIEAVIHNAGRCLALQEEAGSLASFLWRFEPDVPPPVPGCRADLRTTSPESRALSIELKRRGWKFAGPTGMYACMQAVGVVNDHLAGCRMRSVCEAERAAFVRPRS